MESKKLKRYYGYVAYMKKLIESEPYTLKEVSHQEVRKKALQEEYQSIMKNGVWEIIPRPNEKMVITSKWIYKIKHAIDGTIDKYKARFVVRGFSQKEDIYFEEIFAPIARYTKITYLV